MMNGKNLFEAIMFELIPVLSLIFLRSLRCSLVIDSMSQRGIYVSEYCPKMEHCVEGTHVMCMYYDPTRIMGPRCVNAKNVSITPVLADKLLGISNAIRSKIALGKETGKNDKLLPRGFGLFRLQWDNELATFAQVLANQCVLRNDICRATKRFSNPGQTTAIVRFLYPDWKSVSLKPKFTNPGLTVSKIMYAATYAMKSWYKYKSEVTTEILTDYPDYETIVESSRGKLYLAIIHGPATHMGCGISAYTQAYFDVQTPLQTNIIHIVCNYSARPQTGKSVYEMNHQKKSGYSTKCGCPPGTKEDNDCLCYESPSNVITDPSISGQSCSNSGKNKKPAVVLLPIFTVENAPPEKLIARTNLEKMEYEMEIIDLYSPNDTSGFHPTAQYDQANIEGVLNNIMNKTQPGFQRSANIKKPIMRDVKNRVFVQNPVIRKHSSQTKSGHNTRYVKTQSLFSRVPTFELYKKQKYTTFKSDVEPRKDFSNVQKLVENYRNTKKLKLEGRRINLQTTTSKYNNNTINLNSEEEKLISSNYYLRNKIKKNASHNEFDLDTLEANSQTSLMQLLDKLEKGVKHIELDGSKKELFDAKIRKIYDTVVGKPVDLLTHGFLDKYNADLMDFEIPDKFTSDHILSDSGYLDQNHKKLHNKINVLQKNDNKLKIKDRDDMTHMERPINTNRNSASLIEISDKDIISPLKSESHLSMLHPQNDDIKKGSHRSTLRNDDEIKYRHILSNKEDKLRDFTSKTKEKRIISDIMDKRKSINQESDILSVDRRKYYQKKLDNLEKKLHRRHYKHHKEGTARHLRPVLPSTSEEHPLRPGKNKLDEFYLPDGARFLHGF